MIEPGLLLEQTCLSDAALRRALEDPLRQIAQNAGKEGSVIVEEVRKAKLNYGYDALNDKFVDMFQAGTRPRSPAPRFRTRLQSRPWC